MLLGQLLDGSKSKTVTYFSPWFPRNGNAAVFTCQVFDGVGLSGGSDVFRITVQTKNEEDSDKSSSAVLNGGPITISMTPLAETSFHAGGNFSSGAGFLELVRFKYELVNSTGTSDPWVHFRILAPNWVRN